MGLGQVQPSPERHPLLFAGFLAGTGRAESGGFTVGVGWCDCPPRLKPLPLVIWRQAEIAEPRRSTTVYSASEGRGRGHVTVFTSSLTSCGWSSLAGIQWLHQTLLTHILSCLIGKAIKHESSRAPRLCMIYLELSVSSQITLHLLVLCQKTE